MSTSLLSTNLYIPRPSQELVARARLFDKLSEGLQRPLTLVSAPAGFGKTTLVCEWVRQAGLPVAWVSLDQGDNETVRFLSYLISALQHIKSDIADDALAALQSSHSPSKDAILTAIINDVAALSDDFILVLDDYHVIDEKTVHEAVDFLLDHMPPQMHLFIVSRSDPPLHLSRLRVQRQMVEVRTADLRFTKEEANSFFNDLIGLDLLNEDLEVRTEGWIAGMQLAALSMEGRDDKREFVISFAGSHRYLVDEVLSRQSEAIQDFLCQTSILERFCAPLCDVVSGLSDSQSVLNYLEQSNLFLIPLDNERNWYRYHHLFTEFLNQRLRETQPDVIPELHLRASRWFEAEGLTDEAITQAISADDYERAVILIEQVAASLVVTEGFHTLINWVEKMPRDILSRHPRVCIFYAASLMPIGRWDAALPVLQIAEENQELAPHTAVAAYVNALRSFQSTVRRDIDNAISHAKRAIEAVSSRSDITGTIPSSEDDILALSFATFSLSTAYTVSGMHVQANQILPDAVASNKEARNITMLVGALHRWFSNKVVQGRLHEALRICHEALETYQEISKRIGDRRPRPSVELSIQADFGHIQYEWNRLNEAESHIAQALELYELGGTNSPGFRAYKMSALLKQARGDLEGSLLQLRKLDRLKPSVERAASTPLIEWEVLSMTLRLTLSSNFPEIDYLISEVAGWIEARQSQVDEEIEYYREPEYLILSWLRLV